MKYTPTPRNTLLGVGGALKRGAGGRITHSAARGGGGFKICTSHPLPLKRPHLELSAVGA